ncbi:MAG: phosphotransferase family protein [Carbonactinosporaceae bacterium]
MSSMRHLDIESAALLATLDPALRQLPKALKPFSTSSAYELHDVSWIPGERCSLCYRVRSPGSPSTFVAVTLDPDGWSRHAADESLPGLRQASDPATVRELLAATLEPRILACRVEPVRCRPGSRCVLRYDLQTRDGLRTFYAKVFAPQAFADVMPRAVSLARSRDGASLTPTLEAVWPHLQVLVTSAAQGRPASAVLADPAMPAAHRARLAHQLGALLGRFHEIGDVSAPHWPASHQIASVRSSLAATRSIDTALGDRLAALLDTLDRLAPTEDDVVLSHGSFRAGQVIVCDEKRLLALDTDGLCLADRGRDLGTVAAHLLWKRVREPGRQLALRAVEEVLIAGYERYAGRVDPATVVWWRAAGVLQVAVRRHGRLETAAWPLVPELADAAAALVGTLESHGTSRYGTDLLDLSRMTALLRLGLRDRATDAQLHVDCADEMSPAHGGRVLLRYRVRGLDGHQPVTVVGKAFTQSRDARLLHEHLCLLHAGPFREGPLRVPEPLGVLPAQRLVLYRHCGGEPLDLITDPMQVDEGVRLAARWLARLHTSDLDLPREWSLAREEHATGDWAALIGRTYPDLAASAQRLATGWLQAAGTAAVDVRVPIHKDFHAGHVLVGGDVYVLDLDEARQGDPALDLAHFCTYLQVTHGRLLPRSDRHTPRAAFLEEYAARTGWNDKGSFGPFCAYTWLKIAKQRARGSGPFRSIPPAERRAATAQALVEGERCLNA